MPVSGSAELGVSMPPISVPSSAMAAAMRSGAPVARPRCMAGSACALIPAWRRSEEHTSELQSLMRISYAVFCLKKKKNKNKNHEKQTYQHIQTQQKTMH